MDTEIRATFATRRSVELAIEHLVQEHGLNRTDIFVEADGKANSSGQERAGADATGSLSESRSDNQPELEGAIQMSVGCDQSRRDAVIAALKDTGASDIR
ncbi:MAG: hypothetical protein ABW213_09380 [Tardiphaga sp.]